MTNAQILLLDDEQDVLDALATSLRKEPVTVMKAQSAEEASRILQEENVDLIISDERMPGMDGSTFISTVRKTYPEIVCIMLSGHSDMETVLRSINEGEVFRFLLKPCPPNELIQAVHMGLYQRSLMMKLREAVDKHREKETYIEELKSNHPDIFLVERDGTGSIVLPEEG